MRALGIGFSILIVALTFRAPSSPDGAASAMDSAFEVGWPLLRGMDYETGRMSPLLRALEGREVKVPGFVVPLEDRRTEVSEFLLVPYRGACVHLPAPPPNQIVYVRMPEGRNFKVQLWRPVWVKGRLGITPQQGPYGLVGFQLEGTAIEPYVSRNSARR